MSEQYRCPNCGLGFSLHQDYLEHMRCYVPVAQHGEELRQVLGEALSRDPCPWCGELWECTPDCRSRYENGVQHER